jgi:hypothetical protein
MSTALSVRTRRIPDRTGLLAGASALLAVGSVAITLAVTSGDDSPSGPASAGASAATAQPEPAKAYAVDAHSHPLESPQGGEAAAERFHHFR